VIGSRCGSSLARSLRTWTSTVRALVVLQPRLAEAGELALEPAADHVHRGPAAGQDVRAGDEVGRHSRQLGMRTPPNGLRNCVSTATRQPAPSKALVRSDGQRGSRRGNGHPQMGSGDRERFLCSARPLECRGHQGPAVAAHRRTARDRPHRSADVSGAQAWHTPRVSRAPPGGRSGGRVRSAPRQAAIRAGRTGAGPGIRTRCSAAARRAARSSSPGCRAHRCRPSSGR
jgi:hypothetical protein